MPSLSRRRFLSLAVAPLALGVSLAVGCSGDGVTPQRLVVTGSSTVAPLASEIAKRFEATHPGVRVDVQTGGSSRGIADARNGAADIGMASRALREGEQELVAHAIGVDGIAMIVHASNPVADLGEEQVRGIYTGRVQRWNELGGPGVAEEIAGEEIVVVHKADGRATLAVFLEHFHMAAGEVVPDVIIGDNEQGIKTVAGNRNAIGYVSIGAAACNAGAGVPIRLLPASGVAATLDNVRSGRFPITRPLNLVTRGEPTGLAREFIEFARSERVHDLFTAQYFVPVAP